MLFATERRAWKNEGGRSDLFPLRSHTRSGKCFREGLCRVPIDYKTGDKMQLDLSKSKGLSSLVKLFGEKQRKFFAILKNNFTFASDSVYPDTDTPYYI